jgi:hypothetical protein
MNATNGADAASDEDGDGLNAYQEYVSGTDATNSADYLHVASTMRTNTTAIGVRFATELAREYNIWYADNGLRNPTWHLATSNAIPGTGGTREWEDNGTQTSPHPFNATNRTYRIEVQLPQ